MKACGIIAEFDPFHNGHKYLLSQARALGCTHIAVAMSGSAVQRGMPAFLDKYTRAALALDNGADLVLELPAPFSCSSAEIFAKAGVSALAALGEGTVTRLVFGSETDDTDLIVSASLAADALKDSETVRRLHQCGESYPSAVSKACAEEFGSEVASVFESPNSTLALEYCRALGKIAPFTEPCAVKRAGAPHDSSVPSEGFASASMLRELIARGEDVSAYMPAPAEDPCIVERLDSVFLYHLLAADRQQLLSLPDVSEALADRVLKTAETPFDSTAAFLAACKSRNFTLARLRRLALHLVLGVRKEDIAPLPYVRVLALNTRGRELLSAGEHTLPIDTSLARLEKTSPFAQRVSLIERRASALRALGTASKKTENDYKAKIRLKKD